MPLSKILSKFRSVEEEDITEPEHGELVDDSEEEDLIVKYPKYSPEKIENEESDNFKATWEPPTGGVIDPIDEIHKSFLAPDNIELTEPETIKSGDDWAQVLFVNEWPEIIRDGFLNRLFTDAVFDTDASIHLEPRDRNEAIDDLKEVIGEIETELDEKQKKGATAESQDVAQRLRVAKQMYNLVKRQNMNVFDVSMYIAHRNNSEQDVKDQLSEIRAMMERPPANTDVKIATRNQEDGMLSVSPIGLDEMEKKTPMMGGAAAAMFPFTSSTVIEENGVDFGIQPYNGSPIIIDRFGRDMGYNVMVVGNIGSGKSFSTKLNLLRTLSRRDDVDLVMLDPLTGFEGITEALGGKRFVVGGDVGLNPLEIKETPQEVLEKANGLDPYSAKIKDVMSFFSTYFVLRQDKLDDERRGVLERAVKIAYKKRGITRDVETHSNESPTIKDVMKVLSNMTQMLENEEYLERYTHTNTRQEAQSIAEAAGNLIINMEPFTEGGEFENLTRNTQISISDNRVTYLDLQQQEGANGTGLMMQLLFNAVYERAKTTDNKMIFVMDEARYIMREADSLAFLEQAVRHSRHYDLSIQFVTQTVDEFFDKPEAKAIADNCSMIQLNRVDGLDNDTAINQLGMNQLQAEEANNLLAGDEGRGFSEALLGIQEYGWFKIRIRASSDEAVIVDFDSDEMDKSDIPGYDRIDGTDIENRIREALTVSYESGEEVEEIGDVDNEETWEDRFDEVGEAEEYEEQDEENLKRDEEDDHTNDDVYKQIIQKFVGDDVNVDKLSEEEVAKLLQENSILDEK